MSAPCADEVPVSICGAREGAAPDCGEEPISVSGCPDRLPAARDTILRFVTTERLLHWAIAIPFLGCLASAAVLVLIYNPVLIPIYNPDPTRTYRHIFASLHRGCAAGLILCPSLVLLASVRHVRIHLYNVREAWGWRFDDIKWLALMGPATFSKRITLPDQGKFNAAEKLNFMMVMVFSPLLVTSGLMIWFPEITQLDPFCPWMVHVSLTALGTPLLLGHMFMATINPGTRVGLKGMITGHVSLEWAAHHYARWFREQFPDLAEQRAGEHGRDAVMPAPARAGAEPRSLVASVDEPAFEATQQSPVLAARTPLGNAVFDESIARAGAVPDIPSIVPSHASLAERPGQPLPAAAASSASAAAATPHGRISPAVERELDHLRWRSLLADAVSDAKAGIHGPGSAVDDAGTVARRERHDARAAPHAPHAECGVDGCSSGCSSR